MAGRFAFFGGLRRPLLILQGSAYQGTFSGGCSPSRWRPRSLADLASLVPAEPLFSRRVGPVAGGTPASCREGPVAGGSICQGSPWTASRRDVQAPSLEALLPRVMRARAKEASATGARRGPDSEGWWPVESRRSCHVRLRVSHQPRRTVPSDLRGRCFNCLSPEHLAVGCRSPPRCFHCRVLGHRSYDCGRRPLSPRPEPTLVRRKVWRLVRSLAVTTSVPVSSMETIQKDGTALGATRRR